MTKWARNPRDRLLMWPNALASFAARLPRMSGQSGPHITQQAALTTAPAHIAMAPDDSLLDAKFCANIANFLGRSPIVLCDGEQP
jgi:hypothetical protein